MPLLSQAHAITSIAFSRFLTMTGFRAGTVHLAAKAGWSPLPWACKAC